ncbi:bifunctional methylenetetrahydrofolate dehydrogenase/methenyltetrahydrofolate cyclohydrolase, partial [Acinetobacter baumannii]
QLPLPKHINEDHIISAIDVKKDVDGFHPYQVGCLASGLDSLKPCTPAGVIGLLKAYDIEIEGRHAVIIGRSHIVGKPLVQLLLEENATVTVCHSRTQNLSCL